MRIELLQTIHGLFGDEVLDPLLDLTKSIVVDQSYLIPKSEREKGCAESGQFMYRLISVS